MGDKAMMTTLTQYILGWAKERELLNADPTKQMLKLVEELGELAEGMAKDKPKAIEDSIGDIYVVLVILSAQLGLDINDCVEKVWEEIKDRKGEMINGVFVKESDLNID